MKTINSMLFHRTCGKYKLCPLLIHKNKQKLVSGAMLNIELSHFEVSDTTIKSFSFVI